MAVSETAAQLGYAWGAIQAAVNDRATTAQLWADVREAAADAGYPLPSGAFAAVNELRSLAVQQRNSAAAFNSAGDQALMTQAFAALDYNSRSSADRALFPELLARFELQSIDALGNQEVNMYTARLTWTPDMTVGEVRDQVGLAAAGLAADYGVEFAGVGDIFPVTV